LSLNVYTIQTNVKYFKNLRGCNLIHVEQLYHLIYLTFIV